MDKSREEWFEYFEFDRGEEGIWKSAREDRLPFVSILPSPFKDSYPQSGLRLCIFDPVRIEIWPDFLLAFDMFDRLDCDYYITKSGRKIYSSRNLANMDRKIKDY